MNATLLPTLLKTAAAAQVVIAILNLFLVRMMKWQADIQRFPLLIREVFHVHSWFISITLTLFAAMTWRFAAEFAGGTNGMATWLAWFVGIFWGFRVLLQIFYYDANHWKGQPGRTMIHVILLVLYGGMAGIYLTAALR